MAVYTEVSFDEAAQLFDELETGQLQSIQACAGGIENTNYFADTNSGQYVLTLFERLMKHLAAYGIPVPDPSLDKSGAILHKLKGKPAAVVNKLRGSSQLQPTPVHCAKVGNMLARMHVAGQNFDLQQPNLRGLAWWNDTLPVLLPHVTPVQRSLLLGELAYQNHVAESSSYKALPRGVIHADLFRDNVMFEGDELTGFFDFYFAGCDTFLFDISVCLNDWCIDLATGQHDAARAEALLAAYQAVRRLTFHERSLLPAMARAGALRFWISRLWDPSHFEQVLRQRVLHPVRLS